MNLTKTYVYDLALLCHASIVGVTHEEVTPYALVRLMGLACAGLPTWCHVRLHHARPLGVTKSCRLL
jgi:hypothetical protein